MASVKNDKLCVICIVDICKNHHFQLQAFLQIIAIRRSNMSGEKKYVPGMGSWDGVSAWVNENYNNIVYELLILQQAEKEIDED